MYQLLWRNKWLTSDAKNMDEMIDSLQNAVDLLKSMKRDGIKLDTESNIKDDYAYLVTENESVAEKYEFDMPFYTEDECDLWDQYNYYK